SLADRVLGARIGPGCVKVGKSCLHKEIYHLLRLLHIDGAVLLGQAHQPEAQFFDIFSQITHHSYLLGLKCMPAASHSDTRGRTPLSAPAGCTSRRSCSSRAFHRKADPPASLTAV